MWRFDKDWKGLRREVPWVDRPPSEMIREHVRLTIQPLDAPPDEPAQLVEVIDQLGCDDMLMFSTDYPHAHFDDPTEALPAGSARRSCARSWPATRAPLPARRGD